MDNKQKRTLRQIIREKVDEALSTPNEPLPDFNTLIQNLEAESSREMCKRNLSPKESSLPKDIRGIDREGLTNLGFVFTNDLDTIFVKVKFPPGWLCIPTEHRLWSNLIDQNQKVRATIFFKDSPWDRRAYLDWNDTPKEHQS